MHLHHFSKIKSKNTGKSQNSRNQGFSYYFCLIRIHISDQWIRIQEAQKHTDPTDSDPEHFTKIRIYKDCNVKWFTLTPPWWGEPRRYPSLPRTGRRPPASCTSTETINKPETINKLLTINKSLTINNPSINHQKTITSQHRWPCSVSGPDWIRIQSSSWIRIRIHIRNPDPDSGGQTLPTKVEKSFRKFLFRSAGCTLLRASSVAWTSFLEA